MSRVTIGAALGEALRFIGDAWTRAWGIMLAVVALTAALQSYDATHPGASWVTLLGLVGNLFVGAAVTGALYRLRLSDDHPGDEAFVAHPAGLQWGALEWRVLGASVLIGVIIGVLVFAAFIVWAIILGVTVGQNPALMQAMRAGTDADKLTALWTMLLGPAGVLTLVIVLPIILAILYLAIRFSLFAALAAETGRFDLGRAWGLGRGVMLTLIVGTVLIIVADFLIGAVIGAGAGAASAMSGHPGQGGAWGGVAGQVVGAMINAPLFAGLALYVYRMQRGEKTVAATFA